MVIAVVVLVLMVSLTVVVAASVAGAYGFPKTLLNVALQQLAPGREQQNTWLKRPGSPQGTAATVAETATKWIESAISSNECS